MQRPEPAPYVRRGDCFGPAGLAMTDPSPNPLPREREIWIGRFAPFDQPAGLAITDPSPYPLPWEKGIWIGRLASFNQPTALAMTARPPLDGSRQIEYSSHERNHISSMV